MKYGLKVVGAEIVALSEYPDDILPADFIELTQLEYEALFSQIQPFMKYEDFEFVEDTVASAAHLAKYNLNLRWKRQNKVIELQGKIAALTLLGETICAGLLQDELDAEVAAYGIDYPVEFDCGA